MNASSLLVLAVVCNASGDAPPAERSDAAPWQEIRIEAGYGYLTSLTLKKDGTGEWLGYVLSPRLSETASLGLCEM